MKPSLLVFSTVATTLAVVSLVFYASHAKSEPKPNADASPVYVPLGSSGSPDYTNTWILDSANRKVFVCEVMQAQGGSRRPSCRSTDLPSS